MIKYIVALALTTLSLPALSNDLSDCGNNNRAIALAVLIKADRNQKRDNIRCNKLLADAALAKARKMSEFGLVVHNLGGSPNSHLRNANYKLPSYYGTNFDSNQVEAIAGGYTNENLVWKALKNSKQHRTHLLGEHPFYLEQDEIGIAFISDWSSPHVEYWVIYLAKGAQPNQLLIKNFTDIPNKQTFVLDNK